MRATPTVIPEVIILEPKVFGDDRGFFFESFNALALEQATGETAEFLYKATDSYAPEFERSLLWNDPALNINWPIDGELKLSAKDADAMTLNEAELFAKHLSA